MKIFFEEWVKSQNFSETVNRLFEEAFICYRAKGYRASLLFSFTAFQKILKYRLVNSSTPKTYEEKIKDWGKIVAELSNEDRVDHKIIQCINQNKQDNQIFNLSEDIRNQYTFWKDRRNDCAHGKSNIISINHVEAFWLFLQSNLSKFQVNGGKEALYNKIEEFLDDDITPKDASEINIIEDIPRAVSIDESKEFFEGILKLIFNQGVWESLNILLDKEERLLVSLLKLPNEYSSIYFKVLKENTMLLGALLHKDVNILQYIEEPAVIRSLWRKYLILYSKDSYKVIIGMLKYDLIPENEKEELFEICLNKFNDYFFEEATEIDFLIFTEKGFIEYFEKLAFEERKINNFNWSERNRNLVCFYIKYTTKIGEEVVKAIDLAFAGFNYPYKLRDALKNLFTLNQDLYDNLIKEFEDNDLEYPDVIKIM
ncbi:hypothetical protein R0K05_15175 [Planococcus sp. SIMBA_160]